MKFLCIGYFDQTKMDALPKDRIDEVLSECPRHMDNLYRTEKVPLVIGVPSEASYLQRVGGQIRTTTEASTGQKKAMIGCVFLLEAEDMAEAVKLAALHPTTQIDAGEDLGWYTEVRPVHYYKAET